jgi:hypothetical protein
MVTLKLKQSVRIRPSGTTRINCIAGRAWVTNEGDLRDFILERGASVDATCGLTIIMALERGAPAATGLLLGCHRNVDLHLAAWVIGQLGTELLAVVLIDDAVMGSDVLVVDHLAALDRRHGGVHFPGVSGVVPGHAVSGNGAKASAHRGSRDFASAFAHEAA